MIPHIAPRRLLVICMAGAALALAVTPATAWAFNPLKPACKGAGLVSGVAGKVCGAAAAAAHLAGTATGLSGGSSSPKGVSGLVSGVAGAATSDIAGLGLAAVATWAAHGAQSALDKTATLLSSTTEPQLETPWFSNVYWRVAAMAALLTLPFLCAAAVQALLRSDLALLTRCAFGYLPAALLAVGVAAQLTGLLLTVTDELSALVAHAASGSASDFLARAGATVAAADFISGSPFLAFVLAVFTVSGAILLWVEMVMREAAVYVVVVMLPLAFSAMVWPARRIWALRAVELLVALILSKLAIVTVLTLGGAALSSLTAAGFLAGLVLLVLGAFAPWAMLRLVPLAELASGAAGRLHTDLAAARTGTALALEVSEAGHWAAAALTQLHGDAELPEPAREAAGAQADAARRRPSEPEVSGDDLAASGDDTWRASDPLRAPAADGARDGDRADTGAEPGASETAAGMSGNLLPGEEEGFGAAPGTGDDRSCADPPSKLDDWLAADPYSFTLNLGRDAGPGGWSISEEGGQAERPPGPSGNDAAPGQPAPGSGNDDAAPGQEPQDGRL